MRRRALAAAATLAVGVTGCGPGPDGDRPSRTPGPSPAPADFVLATATESRQALEESGLRMRPLPDEAVLNGPHYAFALDSVAVVSTLNPDQLRAMVLSHDPTVTELVAGDGREFLVVYVAKAPSAPVPQRGEPEAEVVVDGQAAHPLSRVPAEGTVVVANVPAGARTVLAVTDAGETKTISLRTGRRVPVSGPESSASSAPPSSPADELAGGMVHLEDMVHIDRVTPEGKAYEFSIRVQVRPYSFVDGHGRADPGRMWLRVELDLTMPPALELDGEPVQLDLDVAGSLVIRGGGETVPVPDDAVAEQVTLPAELDPGVAARVEWSGVLDAPDTLRVVEVSFRTRGTFTAGSQALGSRQFDRRNSGTIDLTGG